jgi:hypothetical protein
MFTVSLGRTVSTEVIRPVVLLRFGLFLGFKLTPDSHCQVTAGNAAMFAAAESVLYEPRPPSARVI